MEKIVMIMWCFATQWTSIGAKAAFADLEPVFRKNLQEIANAESVKYDCAFALALKMDGISVAVSAGNTTDDIFSGQTGSKPITPNAKFAWGSVTKMVTGVSIIRLANEGKFNLDDKVAPILNPYFFKHGYHNKNGSALTLAGMFGPDANNITIRQLATMRAGVPDFDTAKPDETNFSKSTDPFRAHVYANPTKDWSPFDLMGLPWVSSGKMEFAPGTDQDYSSTNFMLLGFVLAATYDVPWDQLDQSLFRTASAIKEGLLNNSNWAIRGAPKSFTNLHAYDRTSYNHHNASSRPGVDVSNVHGVFGGWTASDIVAPVGDIAELAYAIYGPPSPLSLISQDNITMMTHGSSFYGFATFLLSSFTGQPTDGPATSPNYGTCWGHLGATYGWNSVVQFTPGINVSIAVATNVESNEQAQPSDGYCVAYNRIRQLLKLASMGQVVDETTKVQDCEYVASGYFGTCVCPNTYYTCEKGHHGGGRCRVSFYANQSYASCSETCH